MADLLVDAYIISVDDFDEGWVKVHAFMGKEVSQKAHDNGAWADDKPFFKGKGFYPLRNISFKSQKELCFGGHYGARDWDESDTTAAGLCVGVQLIYDPTADYAKSVEVSQTVWVDDFVGPLNTRDGKFERKQVTSTADIVTFGGKEYVWLNKAECEIGDEVTMRLQSLNLEECAKRIDENRITNDYGGDGAKALRDQCQLVVTEGCTEEELAMIVRVRLSEDDGYANATPVFTKEQEKFVRQIRESLGFPQLLLRVEEVEHTD